MREEEANRRKSHQTSRETSTPTRPSRQKMLPRVRVLILKAHSLLAHRVRVRTLTVPLYAPLALSATLLLSVILTLVIRANRVDESKLRSHHIYPGYHDDVFHEGCVAPQWDQPRANASFVVLARNQELEDVVRSVKSLERHFNQWYGYPWVFLNDEDFSEEFKHSVKKHTSGSIEFGVIPRELWDFPTETKQKFTFSEGINIQGDQGVMYGAMESYHKMCRFYSGGFYKHPLVRQYEWYWRVEPDVDFFCDIPYDPFMEMKTQGKKYGFVIMIRELVETVPNLFRVTRAWLKKNEFEPRSAWKLFTWNYKKQVSLKDEKRFEDFYRNIKDYGSMESRVREVVLLDDILSKLKQTKEPLMSDDSIPEDQIEQLVAFASDRHRLPTLQGEQVDDEEYNLLHFWSNFEIARVDLWDNPVYESYFQYLEESGGFYKERWGDAPVHSLAVGFLLNLNQLHYFRDIGYQHTTIRHCPANHRNQEPYTPADSFLASENYDRKLDNYWKKTDAIKDYGVGCRCRCPKGGNDVEDSPEDFYNDWFQMIRKDWVPDANVDVKSFEREVRQELRKEGKLIEKTSFNKEQKLE
jgi:mannosyltransferase